MAEITTGVQIQGTLTPTYDEDKYAVTDPKYGLGGYREVTIVAALTNPADPEFIPLERQRKGMLVYADDTDLIYKLVTPHATAPVYSALAFGAAGLNTNYLVGGSENTIDITATDGPIILTQDGVDPANDGMRFNNSMQLQFGSSTPRWAMYRDSIPVLRVNCATSPVDTAGETLIIDTGTGGAASATSGGLGGAFNITTGAGGAAATGPKPAGAGGAFNLTGGKGGAAFGSEANGATGGSVTLTAGQGGDGASGVVGGSGGVLTLNAGNAGIAGGGTEGFGGNLNINGGGSATNIAGNISILAGGTNTGTAGDTFIQGGLSSGTSKAGDAYLRGAANISTGDGGDAYVRGGASVGGTVGDVYIGDLYTGSITYGSSSSATHLMYLADNSANAFVMKQGTGPGIEYLKFNTTTGSEEISIANSTDNPITTFKGTGGVLLEENFAPIYFQGTESWNPRITTLALPNATSVNFGCGQARTGNGGMQFSVECGAAGNASEPGDVGATGNDATHVNLASSTVTEDDFYNGMDVEIVAGTGSGQTRTILDYVGATKIAEVTVAWGTIPDGTSDYVIHTKTAAKDGRPLSLEAGAGGDAGTVAGETAGVGGYVSINPGRGGFAATSTNGAANGGHTRIFSGGGGEGNATFAGGRGGHAYFTGGDGGAVGAGTVGGIGGDAYFAGGRGSGTSVSGDAHIAGGESVGSAANGAVYLGSVFNNIEPGGQIRGKTSAIYIGNTTDRPATSVYGHMQFEGFDNTGTNDIGLKAPILGAAPTSTTYALEGDLVVRNDAGNESLYIYANSAWRQVSGGGGGGNTLDQAYDQGGAGAGRQINVDQNLPVYLAAGTGTPTEALHVADDLKIELGTGKDDSIRYDSSADRLVIESATEIDLVPANDEILLGATAPSSGGRAKIFLDNAAPVGTETGFGRGSLWIDMLNGVLYINTGDNTTPSWIKVGQQN